MWTKYKDIFYLVFIFILIGVGIDAYFSRLTSDIYKVKVNLLQDLQKCNNTEKVNKTSCYNIIEFSIQDDLVELR